MSRRYLPFCEINSNLENITPDDTLNVNKNFLLVSTNDSHPEWNRPSYFYHSANENWNNEPPIYTGKEVIGYRQVYKKSDFHILVTIIEMHPVAGRIWNNFYNINSWEGWKVITPN